MRPVARNQNADVRSAVVPILVDMSRSMASRTRTVCAGSIARGGCSNRRSCRRWPRGFTSELLAFGEGSTPPPRSRDGFGAPQRSHGALQARSERVSRATVAGIVLLSDGGDTSGGGSTRGGDGRPVFPIGVGSLTVGRDREVLSVTAAEAVLDDSRVDLAVSAGEPRSRGCADRAAPARERPADRRPPRRRRPPTARRSASLPRRAERRCADRLHRRDSGARRRARAREQQPQRARAAAVAAAPRPARRGRAGFEHSFLQTRAGAATAARGRFGRAQGQERAGRRHVLHPGGTRRAARSLAGLSATREALFGYDAIVLANVEGGSFSTAQLEATRDFVGERGGGLLVLGAQSFLRRADRHAARGSAAAGSQRSTAGVLRPAIVARREPRRADRRGRGASRSCSCAATRRDPQALGGGSRRSPRSSPLGGPRPAPACWR